MKNKKIIIPAMLLVLTAAAASPLIYAQAAGTDNASSTSAVQKIKNFVGHRGRGFKNKNRTAPTAEQTAAKAARDAKIAAVNTALENNDYNAWVAAMNALKPANAKEQNDKKDKNEANDPNEKNEKADVKLTDKINQDNFPKLVEAYNLKKQLDAKLTELGINNPDNGKGIGFGIGMGRGMEFER